MGKISLEEYLSLTSMSSYDKESIEKIISYNKSLVRKYKFLKFDNDDDYMSTWADMLPTGWRLKFGESLFKELKKVIKRDKLKNYKIVEIKEKFGVLRLYSFGGNEDTEAVVKKYEDVSQYVCQICGKPAEVVTLNWIGFYCKDCARKYFEEDDYGEIE